MMKKIAILVLFILTTTVIVDAQDKGQNRNQFGRKGNNPNGGHQSYGNGKQKHSGSFGVAAPLDGGLLLVLGGVGVAYYIGRKKREDS